MNLRFFSLAVFFLIGSTSHILMAVDLGNESDHAEALNERDFQPLRDYLRYVQSQPDNVVNEAGLITSGEVRFEWRNLSELGDENQQLRKRPFSRRSRNDFDLEFKLRFDYVKDRGWAAVQVEFDNSGGVDGDPIKIGEYNQKRCNGSGHCEDVCLKKAYMGYRVVDCGELTFDVELGRRNLYNAFDSQIQFLSRYDGVLLYLSHKNEDDEERYWKWGGFIVDETNNHYAWVTELGWLNIQNSGFGAKYSLIDWRGTQEIEIFDKKDGEKEIKRVKKVHPKGCEFVNSQITLYYYLDPEWLCGKTTKLFTAFVYNHAAKDFVEKDPDGQDKPGSPVHKKQPIGWYVGMTVGKVRKAGDWSMELQYQYVQAQAMPDADSSGIGRGNINKDNFVFNNRGNTNFQGFVIEGLYALTDQISLNPIVEYSKALNTSIGGKHTYSKFELEFIYAF